MAFASPIPISSDLSMMKILHWLIVGVLVSNIAFSQENQQPPDEATAKSTTTAQQIEIEFLSVQAGADVIVSTQFDNFVADLYPREAAAMTGVPRGDKTIEESREAATAFFRKAILDFEPAEKAALEEVAKRVVEKFGPIYPRLVNRPWRFIKTRRDLCGGFSFTRNDCIVLSEPTLARFIDAAKLPKTMKSRAESLLLHEQMHVLQRQSPELLKPLYEEVFAFRSANVEILPWVQERQISNPDGLNDNWVAEVREQNEIKQYWIGTILPAKKPLHIMGRDFVTIAISVSEADDGTFRMRLSNPEDATEEEGQGVPEYVLLEELKTFTSRFPIRGGYDHPNEVAAYLFTAITHNELPESVVGEAAEVLNATQEWFKLNLQTVTDTSDKKDTNDEE